MRSSQRKRSGHRGSRVGSRCVPGHRSDPERERAPRVRRDRAGFRRRSLPRRRRARRRGPPRGSRLFAAARRRSRSPPAEQSFWDESFTGSGEQTLEWAPEEGDWRVVLMNADGSRGVSAEMRIGAKLDSLLWIGIGLLVVGGLLTAAAALAITAAVRRCRGGARAGSGATA